MEGKTTVTAANKVFLAFTAGYLAFQVILSIFALIRGDLFISDNFNLIILINEYVIIMVPVFIYTVTKLLNVKSVYRFNRLDWKPALMIIAMSIPVYFTASAINSIIIYLLQFIGDIPAQPIPVPADIKEYVAGLFVIALTPAICEELLHRGILLSAYERRGTIRAVVITSLFFGIFHFDITNLAGPVFIGIIIGSYVIRTNSIFAGMLAHFCNNAIAETILYFSGRNTEIYVEIEAFGPAEFAMAIFMAVAGIFIVRLLYKLFKKMTVRTAAYLPAIATKAADAVSVLSHWPVIAVLAIYAFMVYLYFLMLASGF